MQARVWICLQALHLSHEIRTLLNPLDFGQQIERRRAHIGVRVAEARDDGVENDGRSQKVGRLINILLAEKIVLVLRNSAAGGAQMPPREFRVVDFFNQNPPRRTAEIRKGGLDRRLGFCRGQKALEDDLN